MQIFCNFFSFFLLKCRLVCFAAGAAVFLCISRTSLGLRYRRRRAFSLTSFSLRYTDGGGVSSCFALGFLSASAGICKGVEMFLTPTDLASSRLRRESSPGTSTAASTGTSNRRRPRHRWGCLHHHRPPHRWRESPETSTASSYRWRRWLRRWQRWRIFGAFSGVFP